MMTLINALEEKKINNKIMIQIQMNIKKRARKLRKKNAFKFKILQNHRD